MIKFIKSLYIGKRIYWAVSSLIVLYITGHFIPFFESISDFLLLSFFTLILIDILMLYNRSSGKISAKRTCPERLSNGDFNEIDIYIKNLYPYTVNLSIIDEIPHQFQKRDFLINEKFYSGKEKQIVYKLRPTQRGEYLFGKLNIYVSGIIGLFSRRFIFDENTEVPVYPSFLQMRKYELMAISNRLTDVGIKKIRRISNNKEFEQIKEYVAGDDYRTVNWKATARKSKLMVNQFQDEKSQRVYSIIDMGRTMKMPFNGLSLLDYAINSALVISNIAMHKHDKAGLITFSKKIHSVIPADKNNRQMNLIMETLYKQKTNFDESDFERLYSVVSRKIHQRSLLLIYTNFEGLISLERQKNFFKYLSKRHLVVAIFFKNTELYDIIEKKANNTEEIYIKTIAEQFDFEKRAIVKELKKIGIHSILTEPENLTVNTINKYLELKARGLI